MRSKGKKSDSVVPFGGESKGISFFAQNIITTLLCTTRILLFVRGKKKDIFDSRGAKKVFYVVNLALLQSWS